MREVHTEYVVRYHRYPQDDVTWFKYCDTPEEREEFINRELVRHPDMVFSLYEESKDVEETAAVESMGICGSGTDNASYSFESRSCRGI